MTDGLDLVGIRAGYAAMEALHDVTVRFPRGSLVAVSALFTAFKAPMGILGASWAVGALTFGLALLSLRGLKDTFGKDLDYLEPH